MKLIPALCSLSAKGTKELVLASSKPSSAASEIGISMGKSMDHSSVGEEAGRFCLVAARLLPV